ncbi:MULTISPECIES: alpha/beta hydrolase [unclassified Embleya]|uniref:alpha/beta fold hydrolase n=1 Tax=unclassified Embleya TaxID=2699296 RepID=UPI0033F8B782
MGSRTAGREELVRLGYRGFAYKARIVHQPNPRIAPVVLLGGAFQQRTAWGRIEQGLRPAATVITMDLPGAGDADRLPADYGFDFLTGAFDHLLGTVAAGRVNVVGASYGSAVAHRWVQLNPERVDRILLIGTMSGMTEHVRAAFRRTADLAEQGRRGEFVDSVLESLLCSDPNAAVARQATVARCLSRLLNALSDGDVARYLDNTHRLLRHDPDPGGATVTTPVLITTGEHDPLTTPRLSREAAARYANAHFTTIKGADHLVHLERPTELVDLGLRYFSGRPLTGLDYCHPVEHLTH